MAITIDGDGTITGLSAGGLPNNSVQTADIADDQITLAKLAGGTDGQIITYDASGNPVAVGPGSDGQILTSTGAGSPPAFEAAPTGGKVNQIVQYTDNANRDLGTTGSWTQVPSMEKAITTTDNSSKVLVQHMGVMYQDSADLTAGITVYRDSTNLGSTEYGFNAFYGNNNDVAWNVFIHYLDTPGTAGSYTYKIYYKTDKSDGHYNQWVGRISTSVITLTEILP